MSFYNGGRGGFLSNIPTITKNIILINVLVFIMTMINEPWMISKFALYYPTSPLFRPWQILTHMFMHGGFWHLFFNMYTFLIFGSVLENRWGPKKFLFFYFVTGLGAAALHTFVEFVQMQVLMEQASMNMALYRDVETLKYIPTVGASGAIYGVLLGYAMLYPDSVLTLLFPPISLKAKWFVIIFAAIELFSGVSGGFGVEGGVAHFAHLGGMLFGWLIILYWKKKHTLYDYE